MSSIASEWGGSQPHALSEYRGKGNAPSTGAIKMYQHFQGTVNDPIADWNAYLATLGSNSSNADQSIAGHGNLWWRYTSGFANVGTMYGSPIVDAVTDDSWATRVVQHGCASVDHWNQVIARSGVAHVAVYSQAYGSYDNFPQLNRNGYTSQSWYDWWFAYDSFHIRYYADNAGWEWYPSLGYSPAVQFWTP